jgi:hypothetical protein
LVGDYGEGRRERDDPVELNPDEVRSLAAGLRRLADEMDEHDA